MLSKYKRNVDITSSKTILLCMIYCCVYVLNISRLHGMNYRNFYIIILWVVKNEFNVYSYRYLLFCSIGLILLSILIKKYLSKCESDWDICSTIDDSVMYRTKFCAICLAYLWMWQYNVILLRYVWFPYIG